MGEPTVTLFLSDWVLAFTRYRWLRHSVACRPATGPGPARLARSAISCTLIFRGGIVAQVVHRTRDHGEHGGLLLVFHEPLHELSIRRPALRRGLQDRPRRLHALHPRLVHFSVPHLPASPPCARPNSKTHRPAPLSSDLKPFQFCSHNHFQLCLIHPRRPRVRREVAVSVVERLALRAVVPRPTARPSHRRFRPLCAGGVFAARTLLPPGLTATSGRRRPLAACLGAPPNLTSSPLWKM